MRIIGIDHGLSRIGLAVWDSQADVVLPLGVLAERDFEKAVRSVSATLLTEGADLAVVGVPRRLSGEAGGEQAERALSFAAALRRESGLPVETDDERLSSRAADSLRSEGSKGEVSERDALAAVAILESYIDRHGEYED